MTTPDPVQSRVASIESGTAGSAARNPNSSASGALQITDGLWADYAPRLGLQPSQRNDNDAQGRVFQAFRSDVTPELRGVLGRDPEPAELYGAWLLGRAGAKALYSANQGEDAQALYARVAGEGTAAAAFRNNGNIMRPGMTVGDLQQSISSYYNRRPGENPAPPGDTAQLPAVRPALASAPSFPQAAPVSNAAEQLQVPEQPAFAPDRSAPWMALGAGLLGGSGLADGFARGLAGFQEASQQGRRQELVSQNAASDRAFRLATARATLAASENDRAARREQFQQTREDNQQARADTLTDRREGRAETLAARADALRIAASARGEAAQVAAASRAEAGQQRQLGEVTKTELPLIETLASSRETVQRGRVILNQLDNGELSLGPVDNAWSGARNWAGWSSQTSQNYAELQRYVSTTVNAILNQAKGPQTDQDAIRARENILANLNDPAVVRQGLEELIRIQSQIHADTESRIQGRRRALSLPEADLSNYGLPQIRNAAPADGILNIRRIN
ncbi:hypothetical protein IBL26_08265 [Roseomonas aerophila]|uniref:Phage tail lysozyme domain-containing protein n=1 Tax=Teichococcus aerophilus TaxID=1224513 RepID=A0ABR7RK86_9PROT|nr:hypothetical protein [Pseudoroseomonas aerophila]MBC9206828.1 hypothetical protein [Pseudoroseomonas aerophila]